MNAITQAHLKDKFAVANGVHIAYQEFGNSDDPAVLLISGVATQLTSWPINFCEELADSGYRVIRFDNRDTGLSQKFSNLNTPNPLVYVWKKQMMLPRRAPYTLRDMSDDVIGLMNALNIRSAHLIGASMGGMIAQLVASRHPSRTLTLTSIMSTSGSPLLPGPKAKMMLHLLMPRPKTKSGILKRAVKTLKIANAGSKYAQSEQEMFERVRNSYERSHYPQGAARHMIAISASGSRIWALRKIKAPTLVIHGANDPMIPPAAGRSTARYIKNASLAIIDQMGHDLPPALTPTLMGLLKPHLAKASLEQRSSGTFFGRKITA